MEHISSYDDLRMFEYASRFNGEIGNWDVKNLRSMGGMFSQAKIC